MNIFIVGGTQTKHSCMKYYDLAIKLTNGFIRNGHNVVQFLERDNARNLSFFRNRHSGKKKCNAFFLDQVKHYAPDIVVLIHSDIIEVDTLNEMRAALRDVKVIQFTHDAIFTPSNITRSTKLSAIADASFFSGSLSKIANKVAIPNAYFVPNMVDGSIEAYKAFESDCYNDVFFACGRGDYKGDIRDDIDPYLTNHIKGLKLANHCVQNGNLIWGREYMEAIGHSKIGLNLSRKSYNGTLADKDYLYRYSSDRIAHLTGNGALTFSEKLYCLNELYNEDEMVFFETKEELKEKITYYVNNDAERQKIAKAGHKKAHLCYNEKLVASFMLDMVLYKEPQQSYAWPVR